MPLMARTGLLCFIFMAAVLLSWPSGSAVAVAEPLGIGIGYSGCLSSEDPACDYPGFASNSLRHSNLISSPDSKSAYLVGSQVIVELDSKTPGRLKKIGCMTIVPSPASGCSSSKYPSFSGPYAVVSPDGKHLYHSGQQVALTAFDRHQNGTLTFEECIAPLGRFGCESGPPRSVFGAGSIAVSPNSKFIYMHITSGIATYKRTSTGLKFVDCLTHVARRSCRRIPNHNPWTGTVQLTPDGRTLISRSGFGLVIFRRSADGLLRYQGCIDMLSIQKTRCRKSPVGQGITITASVMAPGGNRFFVVSRDEGVVQSYRILKNGHLEYSNCIGYRGEGGCESAPDDHLRRPGSAVISPSGKTLFVNLTDSSTVERYNVRRTGELEYAGCLSDATEPSIDECPKIDVPSPFYLSSISPNGKQYYFGGSGTWSIFEAVPD